MLKLLKICQALTIVDHCSGGDRQLKYNIALGLTLKRNVTGRLDLLQITGKNGLQN